MAKREALFFKFTVIILFLCLVFFSSCRKKTEIHLHDRHVLSYSYVKNYAEKNGAVTLVLLDYHHDIKPDLYELTSVNWAGKLVEENYVKKIIWLSGKKLRLPNRNARMAWLERSLKNTYPETADKMREAVQLVDWYDLQDVKLEEPFVITLDFDVFMKDPGDDAGLFVDELCGWIQKQKPELVTLSLSASYQPDPENAWKWLSRFFDDYKRDAEFYLESGDFGEREESRDDFEAHINWKKNQKVFKNPEAPFYSGAYLWQNTPSYVTDALSRKKIKAGNKQAEEIIAGWNDVRLKDLKRSFNIENMHNYSGLAKEAMQQFFDGKDFTPPEQVILKDRKTYGVAVRFKNQDEDRGCLSLYSGIVYEDIPDAVRYCAKEALIDPRYRNIQPEEKDSLITNISIFSDWEIMDSCLDFEPGLHSLLLEDKDGEKTLLQAAIALERNYTREEFLARLSNKAGLGLNGWKGEGLKFYKARTLTYSE